MQCVILAGGLGRRMASDWAALPKTLIPVAGQPFAAHQLAWLSRQGVTKVVYCVGHLGTQVVNFVGDGQRWNLHVQYVFDGEPLAGTGGALRRAFDEDVLDPHFLVQYGDSYLPIDYAPFWDAYLRHRQPVQMSVIRKSVNLIDRPNARFVVDAETHDDAAPLYYDKSPEAVGMTHIDYGLTAMRRDVVREMPSNAVVDLAAFCHQLGIEQRLMGYEVAEPYHEVGSPQGLAALETHITLGARP